MVQKYKRKTQQASWDVTTMKLAMEEAGKTSVRNAAKRYGINLSTLQRHIKKGSAEKSLGRFRCVFTEEQETELIEYLFHMDNLFYGLNKQEFCCLAFEYAKANNIPHPFKQNTAGDDWYKCFRIRHPEVTLRQPEPTSVARARGFNRPQVERFFNLLEEQIDKHKVDATRIYNVDETGIQTTSNRPPKVLSKTGKKQVGVISSVERGKLTTIVCCCNAAGGFIPPFMIFGRKRMQERLLDGSPPGTEAVCTENGWISGPTFLDWLRHFVAMTRPTQDKKVILIMDNHSSHKYLPALDYASKNHVIFISLAPHTTHRTQPLDRCIYGPLKSYFEQAVSVFQRNHVGRIISQYDVAKLFGEAYLKAASPQNAVKGFKSTGIWPTNRFIFTDDDYLPATMTDRPEAPNESDIPTSAQIIEDSNEKSAPVDEAFSKQSALTVNPDQAKTKKVTPMDIRPTPKQTAPKTSRKRKLQKAEILTSTPIKEQQREIELKKQKVPMKKLQKKVSKNKSTTKGNKKATASTSGKKKTVPSRKTTTGPKQASEEDVVCFLCQQKYTDPPDEDWIKCDDCQCWVHEACTGYSGIGAYYCDLCL